jgi:two-component system response regulator AtoC
MALDDDLAPVFWNRSPDMQGIAEVIRKVADSDVTVLIRGESGVGKELVARAVHSASPRAGRPYIKVNCAALPAELLESELFGHERGAFTGAVTTRVGRFEQADAGTIFLDEIGELSAGLQAKLLHVVQDGYFARLGSNRPIQVDVRIVAATNRDLEEMMERGAFREDLFYRLKVIEIAVPPLRMRREEIIDLSRSFVRRYARQYNRPVRELSPEVERTFQRYDWPGNVRELENMIKRIVILQDEQAVLDEIARSVAQASASASQLDSPVSRTTASATAGSRTESDNPALAAAHLTRLADVAKAAALDAERRLIEETLNRTRWNRKRAAKQLEVSYKTLLNRIRECGICRYTNVS